MNSKILYHKFGGDCKSDSTRTANHDGTFQRHICVLAHTSLVITSVEGNFAVAIVSLSPSLIPLILFPIADTSILCLSRKSQIIISS